MEEQLKKMLALIEARTPFVCATLVEIKGSSPRSQGGKMLVTHEGLLDGTIGGGLVESKAIEFSKEFLESGDSIETTRFVHWNLNKDTGMSCGGSVKIFFELFHANQWDITVFGAGHVAQALIPMLLQLECRISCIDDRQEWLDKLPASNMLTPVLVENHVEVIKDIPANSFVILMTQGHRSDLKILQEFLKRSDTPDYDPQAFLGVIGSRSKAAILRKELGKLNFSEQQINSFFCPLGLSLGGNHSQEIAISISAQLLYERDRLKGDVHQRNPLP